MKTSSVLFASLVLLAAVSAQEKTSFRFVPADAQVVFRLDAPARWQARFADTKVARLLASEAVAPWLAKGKAAFDEGMEAARAKGEVDVDAVQRFLADYRGEIVVAVHLDLDRLPAALENDEPVPFRGTIALTPDGTFDLAAFCAAMAKTLEQTESNVRDLVVGEHTFRVSEAENGFTGSLPAMVDGHCVFVFGNDLETSAARLLGAADRMAAPAADAPLWCHADVRGVMLWLQELARQGTAEDGMPIDGGDLVRELGLMAIESFSTSIAPDGDRVAWDFTIGTGVEHRGLLDVVATDGDAAKLLRWLPPGADSFSALAFDLGPLYSLVQRVWAAVGDDAPLSFDDAMAAFQEATKVRLKEDLLDHLGKGAMILQDVGAALDVEAMMEEVEDNPMGAALNACYVFSLRDGKAFGDAIETLLRARGLHAARKSEEYQGTKIHRLRLAGVIELEYAVTADLLLLAAGHGEAPGQSLRGVLDARAQGASEELGKISAVAALPKGWVGLSVSPIARTLTSVRSMMTSLEQMGELPDPERRVLEVMEWLGQFAGELERSGLGTLVSATYADARQLKMRILW
jgi:hypothetical protein